MAKLDEKGKCVECSCLYIGADQINAWCMFKRMRFLCSLTIPLEDLRHGKGRTIYLSEKYNGQLIDKLKNKTHPSWCPKRN